MFCSMSRIRPATAMPAPHL